MQQQKIGSLRKSYFFCSHANSSSESELFIAIGSDNLLSDEDTASLPLTDNIRITRCRGNVHSNSKDGNTTYGFRDDGVTVVSVTVGAGVSGQFDSGEISITIAAESLVNFVRDTSASTTGSIRLSSMYVEWKTA